MLGKGSIAAALAALPAAVWAQDVPVKDDHKATLTFALENDGYFGDDDNYTSGLRLGYLSGNKPLSARGRVMADVLGLRGDREQMRQRRGLAIAQEIYTPRDLDVAAPPPDQHPYAGYLYVRYTALIEQPSRVDQMSVELGVVGPEALGEHAQNLIHDTTGRERALGWDNQIDTAVGINVSYDQQQRIAHGAYDGGIGWDCVPYVGFQAGTVKTAGRAGFNLRFGEALTVGYGPPRVRPAGAGSGFFVPQHRRSWYVFAGAQLEAVAHNIFLDNSLFRDRGPSVESKAWVWDTQAGIAAQIGGVQASFTYVLRSEEFFGQDGDQRFGALTVSTRF
ncbi:lipid A deacylase LpxR family protein [Parvularcula lutaonensis]|uniref:Lipid A deacylase LpxR family protein n=1 Tax=Parvularcula lutaonensis TaxID=491923 RepID=A0ABV7MDG8_9PROT|nr:lipid A deacylase LpxR family protein [Parvularcula lutaonensis]